MTAGRSGPRTLLAWDRSTLSAGALGALLLKLGVTHDQPAEIAAGAVALLLAAALALGVRRRRLPMSEVVPESLRVASSGRAVAAVAVLTSLTAVLTVVAVVLVAVRSG